LAKTPNGTVTWHTISEAQAYKAPKQQVSCELLL